MNNVEFDIEYAKQDLERMMFDTAAWWKDRFWIVAFGVWLVPISFLLGSIFLLVIAALMFLIPAILYLALSTIARKSFTAPFFAFPLHVNINESGVSTTWSEGSSTANWTQYSGWLETAHAFLLYQTAYTAVPVPKRCLSPEQQNSIRELLRANVVPKPSKEGVRNFTRFALILAFITTLLLYGVVGWTVSETGHLPRGSWITNLFEINAERYR